MRLHVWPGLNFWFYLAIISSPSWVFSFSAMDFVKKTSGLVFIFLIWILTLLCCAGNVVLSYFYLHPPTNRFFRGYECAGKTTGFLLVVLGNVGLCYFPEKSVACILTFLFLAFYCLCALFCIQPYTGFGALEFLLTASLNPTLRRFGLPSPYSWLVIIACIVIAGIRFTLQPVHPPEQATSDEVDEGQRLRQLEAGLSSPGARLDNNPSPSDIYREPALAGGPTDPLLEDNNPSPSDIYREPALAGGPTDPLLEDNNPSPSDIFREPARAGGPTDPLLEDNNPSPSDIFREPALAGGPTDPLLEDNNPSPSDIFRDPALAGGPTDPLLEDNNPSPSDIFREPARAGGPTDPLLEDIRTYNEDPSPPGVRLDDPIIKQLAIEVRDCYPTHDHELELKRFNKRFTCSRCMQDGFTLGYRCMLCVYDIHQKCMNPKPKISHKLFPGSVFEFRQKPHINGSICDACGMKINGCSYRCEARNLDLHPRCTNLPGKLRIDGTDLVLICKNVKRRCFSCQMKLHSRLVEQEVPGWCYVSERNKFFCHVYCVSQMVQDAWRRGHDNDVTSKALEKVNLKLVAKSNGSGGRGGRLFLKAVTAFLSILFGDPTGLIVLAVTELVQN